jgi:hypothetical protein
MIQLNYDKKFFDKLWKAAEKPLLDLKPFWNILGAKMSADASLAFKMVGARNGNPRWQELSLYTLHPVLTRRKGSGTFVDMDKWRPRIGTDGIAHGKYSEKSNSNILQASRAFSKSFSINGTYNIFKSENKKMLFGTNHQMAKDIMSSPERNVLFITRIDQYNYNKLFQSYMRNQYSKMVI